MSTLLTAEEAASLLGVSRQTLYAYVSRGLLRAREADDPRERRYARDEVTRLAAQRSRGRKPREVAKAALDWGTPVLESGITLIQDGQLYYRGANAAPLAETMSVEALAARLWQCDEASAFATPPRTIPAEIMAVLPAACTPDAMLTRFVMLSEDEPTAIWQREPARVAAGSGALLRAVAGALLQRSPTMAPIDQQCADVWQLDAAGRDLVRKALILCADHELNVSSFTGRCVASAGASLRAVVVAGLAALSGTRHGGATARAEALLDDLARAATPAEGLRQRLARGESVAGFGHPLYPDGDMRATLLLQAILPTHSEWTEVIEAVAEILGRRPTIDLALVLLRRHLGLPVGTAFGLFALGRTIGWIAHALEQRQHGHLIRPRAAYIGVTPERQF